VPIAFNVPYSPPKARQRVLDSLNSLHMSGDGASTDEASAALSKILGNVNNLLVTSCTHALEMTAMLIGIQPGDEVIMPSFTFVSTANAFALRGARPVFVDIRPDTFNIDERLIEAAITERTKAIVVVHYAGVGCEMDEVLSIASKHGLVVIEDNAHGLGGTYKGQKLGTFGSLSTLSFHETKNIQCGEGGALLINDEAMIEPAEIIREKGTNRSRFFRGQVDKYTWVSVGSSYLLADILAAFLLGQLEEFDFIQSCRHNVWSAYREGLADWAESSGFTFQLCPSDREHPAHLFALLAPDLEQRQLMIEHLKERGVNAVFHYVPLHSSPAGIHFGECDLPVTDNVSNRLLRLPLYPSLTDDQVASVISAVQKF